MLLSTVHLKLPRKTGVLPNVFGLAGSAVDLVD